MFGGLDGVVFWKLGNYTHGHPDRIIHDIIDQVVFNHVFQKDLSAPLEMWPARRPKAFFLDLWDSSSYLKKNLNIIDSQPPFWCETVYFNCFRTERNHVYWECLVVL